MTRNLYNDTFKFDIDPDKGQISLVFGTSGSGKSVFLETTAWKYFKQGYSVIFITEKSKNPFESCFATLPIKNYIHEHQCKFRGMELLQRDFCKDLVKIYHPMFLPDDSPMYRGVKRQIFSEKSIPFNWFSMSLKMQHKALAVLLGQNFDQKRVTACWNALQHCDDETTIFDFLNILDKMHKGDQERNSIFDELEGSIDKSDLKSIFNSFRPFRQFCFLQPEIAKTNLNIAKIANEHKFHKISTAFLHNETLKFFVLINILLSFDQALVQGLVKRRVLLVFEELMNVIPKTKSSTVQEDLANLVISGFREWRNSGVSTIGTAQNIFDTEQRLRNAVNKKIFFKLSQDDKMRLLRDTGWKREQLEIVHGLQVGEFVWVEELEQEEYVKYKAHMPPFAHAEEGNNFIEMFSKEYPEMLTDNKILLKIWEELRDEQEKNALKSLKEKIAERKQIETLKEQQKINIINAEEKINKKLQKEMQQEQKIKTREKISEDVYKLKKINPHLQYSKIALTYKKSSEFVKRAAVDYAVKIADWDFLLQNGIAPEVIKQLQENLAIT